MYRATSIAFVAIAVFTLIIFGRTAVQADSPQEYPNINSPLGSNLHKLIDWSSEYPFADAFKLSRKWVPLQNVDGWTFTTEFDDLNSRLDTHGWVKSLPTANDGVNYRYVGTVMFTGLNGNYPQGNYTVYYEGQGTIIYGNDAVKNNELSVAGRDVITVNPTQTNSGISLKIIQTDPENTGNYIRNIRIAMPGVTETELKNNLFNTNFLNSIKYYKVLRFMDWMRTNWDANQTGRSATNVEAAASMLPPVNVEGYNPYVRHTSVSEPVSWANRAKESDAQYTGEEGAPLETMLKLANEAGADPWFNIPHTADDEYVTQFAATVLDNLGVQNIYVEYSNEVWNSGFGQGNWVETQAVNTWPNNKEVTNNTKRLNWYGKRSAEICSIWKQVFGPQANRVICVIAAQATNSWGGEIMLDCPLREAGPCHKDIDAVAIAPYFGQHIGSPTYLNTVLEWANSSTGLDLLFEELTNGTVLPTNSSVNRINLLDSYDNMGKYADIAAARQLFMVAYEGGQHLAGVGSVQSNQQVTDFFARANHDPRMADLYGSYLSKWNEVGGHLFVHYTNLGVYGKWGNWGAQEYYNSADSPKKLALEKYVQFNSCPWAECSFFGLSGDNGVPTSVEFQRSNVVTSSTDFAASNLSGLTAITVMMLIGYHKKRKLIS